MRLKADGQAFEREFAKCFSDRFHVQRLYTPSLGYSGIRCPADYIVVGSRFSYVELKETEKDRFSIVSIQQMPYVLEFYDHQRPEVDKTLFQYWLLVHFIRQEVYAVLGLEDIVALYKARKSYKVGESKEYNRLEDIGGLF